MNQHFLEKTQIAQGFLPVNMQTGANAGDWVSMKNYGRLAIVFFKAAGTAGDDPTITIEQSTNVGGSPADAKELKFTRVDKKQAATNLLAVAQFTTVTQAAGNTFTHADLAEQAAIIVIDIKAEDLDIDGGFDCVRASVADIGTNAQLGCLMYFLHEPRFASGTLPGAIAD
ncbi:MAG: hypothetical protein WC100_06905 [Sterolibacterium sp.]